MEWPIGGLQYLKVGFGRICAYEGDGPRKMRMFGEPRVLLRHPDQVKMIINSDEDVVGVSWPTATRLMLGKHSITFATGANHKSLRRLLGPCFAPHAIEEYLPAIQRICERFCASWAEATAAAESAAADGGPQLDLEALPQLQKEARLLTFEVMAHVVAGFHFSQQQLVAMSEAFDALMSGFFSPVPVAIPGTGFAKSVAARKIVVAALDEQIDSFKRQDAAAAQPAAAATSAAAADAQPVATMRSSVSGGAAGSVMERLMGMRDDDGKPLSREALQDLGINLLFAGHETTAASIVRLMLRLRSRPDVFAKLRSEQREAVAKHGGKISGAALRDMPYLDAVVKEGWRLEPVVPVVLRRAQQDMTINGYDVPKGWGLIVGLGEVIKQHPTWSGVADGDPMDPLTFNPDRWKPASAAAAAAAEGADGGAASLALGMLSSPVGHLPSSMLTFGGGARYCLGTNLAWAEMKTFMSVLVRRYDMSAPLEHMQVKTFPTIIVTGGFPVQVRPLAAETLAAA